MIHSIRRMKGKKGGMAIKVEMEKAYDRVSWPFLNAILKGMGFPDNWISLIMDCVSSTTMSLLWNGERNQEFKPGRGLRQGDPLSSLSFCVLHGKFKQSNRGSSLRQGMEGD